VSLKENDRMHTWDSKAVAVGVARGRSADFQSTSIADLQSAGRREVVGATDY